MILGLIIGIIITVTLAIVIVKFVPKKMHNLISIALLITAFILVWKIYNSITTPIRFNEEKIKRYSKVIDQLKVIRDAENAYKRVTGKYTDDPEQLIHFIDTAKFAITQTRYEVVIEKIGALDVEKEVRITDTIGFKPVIESFKGRNYKNLVNVPGTDKKFDLEVSQVEKVAGFKAPTFEAKIDKASVLKGLNPELISQEEKRFEGDQVKGKDISIGSLVEVKDSGNWPPFYDNRDKKTD